MNEKQMQKTLAEFFAIGDQLDAHAAAYKKKIQPLIDAHGDKVAPLYERAAELRRTILAETFPDTKEGTDSVAYKTLTLKCVTKVPRSVDKAVVQSPEMVVAFRKAGLAMDKLLRWSPDLDLRQYRTLDARQRRVFDQALIIKDPVRTLEIEGKL